MEDNVELDLRHLLGILRAKIKLIAVIMLIFGGIAFLYTFFIIKPMYVSSFSMYVNNTKVIQTEKIDSGDIEASKKLVDTYVTIIKSNSVLDKVAMAAKLSYSSSDIRQMMSAEAISNTEIFRVSIKSSDPDHSAIIANTIAQIAPDEIANFVEASSVKVIDYATVATTASSPNVKMNTLIGLVLGLMISVLLVFVLEMLDVRIKTEEDLEHISDLPILGSIPDMDELNNKTSYSYSSRRG